MNTTTGLVSIPEPGSIDLLTISLATVNVQPEMSRGQMPELTHHRGKVRKNRRITRRRLGHISLVGNLFLSILSFAVFSRSVTADVLVNVPLIAINDLKPHVRLIPLSQVGQYVV